MRESGDEMRRRGRGGGHGQGPRQRTALLRNKDGNFTSHRDKKQNVHLRLLLVVLLAVPLVSKELWVHALGRRVLLLLLLLDTVVEEGREDATQGETKGSAGRTCHEVMRIAVVGPLTRSYGSCRTGCAPYGSWTSPSTRTKKRKRSRKTDHSSATGPRNVEA